MAKLLSEYFSSVILEKLPPPELLISYWKGLSTYLSDAKTILPVRKFKEFRHRGKIQIDRGRKFVCSDNETALWVYMRCSSRIPMEKVKIDLQSMQVPIAFAFTEEEAEIADWKKVGRVDIQFSREGWKHCHLLQCSPRHEIITLEQRSLRLLVPFNHFPFPSPRAYEMSEDWGENPKVINWILWNLFHHYQGEAKEAFLAFVTAAGGNIPIEKPEDVWIDFKPKNLGKNSFHSLLMKIDTSKATPQAISSDEKSSSFEKGKTFTSMEEFIKALERWLDETDEETIGNATFARTAWIHVERNGRRFSLNSDTKRDGVKEFVDNFRNGNPMSIRRNANGTINLITNRSSGDKVTNFHFYAKRPQRTEGEVA